MKKIFSILAVLVLLIAFYPSKVEAKVEAKPTEQRWCNGDIDDEWCCYDCGIGCFSVPKKGKL